jgi:SAM-dependent methyltransferase
MTTASIRRDFDRLALLEAESGWSHNDHYHPYLLRQLPVPCGESLEIGCGTGAFARLMARRCAHVTGLDLSPESVRLARQRSMDYPNIDFRVEDALAWPFPASKYDCIASIATLHHLPLDEMLAKMKSALRPGGVLLVLDLYKYETPGDYLTGTIAVPANLFLRLFKTGRFRPPAELRAAWEEHGRDEVYARISQLRRLCAGLLPGAVIRKHLFFRYSLVWKKPVD